jgi:hypothetical protein
MRPHWHNNSRQPPQPLQRQQQPYSVQLPLLLQRSISSRHSGSAGSRSSAADA